MLTASHDTNLRSWVESANDPETDFPVQNLPLGIFRVRESDEGWRVGVAIGDQVLDTVAAGRLGLLDRDAAAWCGAPTLNALMSLGSDALATMREQLSDTLRSDTEAGERARAGKDRLLHAQHDVELALPCAVRDYSDFYASVHHAANVGSMFRPDAPLLPNYKWVPIGYHGRASSIVVSGTPIRRPSGQRAPTGWDAPTFGPTMGLDYEVEVGFLIGAGNSLGSPIPIDDADRRVFGVCLVNDWSARDIQAWEYQPLGPFLGKSFATSLSPWVVTRQALEPFRGPLASRAGGDPEPLAYLSSPENATRGGVEMTVEAYIETEQMRESNIAPVRLSRGRTTDLYWTPGQLIAHHTSNGCNLRPGDLLASGTVSGPQRDSRGCLLELTWRGAEPLTLPSGETRRFLEDGDEVILRGSCEKEGFTRIGFGECRGRILPSV